MRLRDETLKQAQDYFVGLGRLSLFRGTIPNKAGFIAPEFPESPELSKSPESPEFIG